METFGHCAPVGTGVSLLTLHGLAAAPPPPLAPACADNRLHPSVKVSLGCFDPPCPDCVAGEVQLTVFAAEHAPLTLSLGDLSANALGRTRDSDEPFGIALGSLGGRVSATVQLREKSLGILHCGSVHRLNDLNDPYHPAGEACALLEYDGLNLVLSGANAIGAWTGQVRSSAEGPRLGVVVDDRSDACGPPGEALPNTCLGPVVWAPVVDGEPRHPYQSAGFREAVRASCLASKNGSASEFGDGIAGWVLGEVLCADLLAGKPPRARLTSNDLSAVCGIRTDCAIGDTFQAMYAELRDAMK